MAAKKKVKKLSENNTHWRNMFPQDYLGSHNLKPDEELVVKIIKVGKEDVPRAKKKKGEAATENLPILYFDGKMPKMVLNKTNAKTIGRLYTPYTDKWIGKYIQIFAANVDAFGEKVDALRVRDTVPDSTDDQADVSKNLKAMREIKTKRALGAYYLALPGDLKANREIFALKEELKASLPDA